MLKKLVVTRHKGLVDYLTGEGLIDHDAEIVSHATPEDVVGKHVFGVLPYWLSSKAVMFTEVKLRIPAEMRGKELTLEEVVFYSSGVHTYSVKEIDNVRKQDVQSSQRETKV